MRKSLKESVAVALSITTILSFAGCAKASPTAAGSTGSNMKTWTVWTSATGPAPTENNPILKIVEQKLHVDLKCEMSVGDTKTKVATMIAGDKLDDIMFGSEDLVSANALIPLDKYLTSDEYPNIKKYYGKFLAKLKDPNHGNHVYALPAEGPSEGKTNNFEPNGTGFWIQKCVLKDENWPKIKTLDDYFNAIETYLKKHKTFQGKPLIGFEQLCDENKLFALYNQPAFLDGHPNDGAVEVDENNKAHVFYASDSAKRYFKKLNEEYNKGVIDKEFATLNNDNYTSKISSGTVLGLADQQWDFGDGINALKSQKLFWQTYVGFPLTWDSSIKDNYVDREGATINIGNGYGISRTAKDPDAIMHFFDTTLNREWQDLFYWGIKGKDYEVDKSGHYYRTQAQRDAQNDNNWKYTNSLVSYFSNAPKIGGTWPDGNAIDGPAKQLSEWQATLSDADKEVLKAYGAKSYQDFYSEPSEPKAYYPCWQISVPNGSPAAVELQKLNDLSFQNLPKIIMASPSQFGGDWDQYVSGVKNSDLKSYEDLMDQGIQYRLKNWTVTK